MEKSKFEIGDLVLLRYPYQGLFKIISKSQFGDTFSYKAKLVIPTSPLKSERDAATNHHSKLDGDTVWFFEKTAEKCSLEDVREFADYLNKTLLLINFK